MPSLHIREKWNAVNHFRADTFIPVSEEDCRQVENEGVHIFFCLSPTYGRKEIPWMRKRPSA